MPVTAKIKFVQGLLIPGAGLALVGVAAVPVVCSNENNASVGSYEWVMVDAPVGSAVPVGIIGSGNLPTISFTPDLPGGYLLRLTTIDLAGNQARDFRVFQIAEASGFLIPPFDAEGPALNFGGQVRGWAKQIEELLRYLLGHIRPTSTILLGNAVAQTIASAISNVGGFVSLVQSGGFGVNVKLPLTPQMGEWYVFRDSFGTAGAVNHTVQGNGKTIYTSAGPLASVTMSVNYAARRFWYDGTQWQEW